MQGEFGGKQKAALGVLLRGAGEAVSSSKSDYIDSAANTKNAWHIGQRSEWASRACEVSEWATKSNTRTTNGSEKGRAKRASKASEASASNVFKICF